MTMTLEELLNDVQHIGGAESVAYARAVEAAIKERDELREAAHYADGVASLAMKHRDEAESELDELRGERYSWCDQASDRVKDWNDMRIRAEAAESELDELRNSMRVETETVIRAKEIIDAMGNGWRETQDELDALKQRIAKGRHVRSTRNGVIRTPVGWCEPNTDYTIITGANPLSGELSTFPFS